MKTYKFPIIGGGEAEAKADEGDAFDVGMRELAAWESEGAIYYAPDELPPGAIIRLNREEVEQYGAGVIDGRIDYSVWCTQTGEEEAENE